MSTHALTRANTSSTTQLITTNSCARKKSKNFQTEPFGSWTGHSSTRTQGAPRRSLGAPSIPTQRVAVVETPLPAPTSRPLILHPRIRDGSSSAERPPKSEGGGTPLTWLHHAHPLACASSAAGAADHRHVGAMRILRGVAKGPRLRLRTSRRQRPVVRPRHPPPPL